MKIANKPGSSLNNVDAAKSLRSDGDKRTTGKSSLETKTLGDTAKINLSERAQAMQKAKDIAGDQSVDEAKVARLQKLIDEGNYSINALDVADRLVDEHFVMGDE